MGALVPVPWQPYLFMTPSTLGYFTRASQRLGRPIFFNSSRSPRGEYLSAWRSLDGAIYLWNLFQKGGAPASNPYTGQRNHLRGAAGDILDYSAPVRSACLAVGLTPDPTELWHFNDPHWASMPIISTNTGTASSGATAITPATPEPAKEEDDDMKHINVHGTHYLVDREYCQRSFGAAEDDAASKAYGLIGYEPVEFSLLLNRLSVDLRVTDPAFLKPGWAWSAGKLITNGH